MEKIKNKEEFKEKVEIYNILIKIERAIENKDDLSLSVLLTILKNKNIEIIQENN
jgi:hypothetical protein